MLAGVTRRRNSKAGIYALKKIRSLLLSLAMATALAPLPARADIFDRALGYLDQLGSAAARIYSSPDSTPATAQPQPAAPAADVPAATPDATAPAPEPQIQPREHIFRAYESELSALSVPTLPGPAITELPAPSVEKGSKKLTCVEFTRAFSGLNLFGDAKFWWARAKNVYARLRAPAEQAVMVFSASRRLTKGHVAVVTRIVSSREVRVEHANWQNHGEIDHSTPVMDVSKKNDWSQVRVWDVGSKSFGRIYAVSGFILKNPPLIARE